MRIDFVKNDHQDAKFWEESGEAVPRVGDHVWLRRSNLNGILPEDDRAIGEYIVTRVEWAPASLFSPITAKVYVSSDGGPGSSSYDEYMRLCGAAHVIANVMFAQITGSTEYLLDDEAAIFPEGMFRQVVIWHKINDDTVDEYTLNIDQAEMLARDWHARDAAGERPSRSQLLTELMAKAKKRESGSNVDKKPGD